MTQVEHQGVLFLIVFLMVLNMVLKKAMCTNWGIQWGQTFSSEELDYASDLCLALNFQDMSAKLAPTNREVKSIFKI